MLAQRKALVDKWRGWKASNPNWPLTVHSNGQWCKKVRGGLYYFGPLEDPQAARKRWLAERDYLIAGEAPPAELDGYTIDEIGRLWLDSQEARRDRGELSQTTFTGLVFARNFALDHLPPNRPITSVTPVVFSQLRRAIAETGRNLRSQKNLIVDIRTMFRWVVRSGYIPSIEFGPEFVIPSSNAIAREREQSGRDRFLNRNIILATLDAASSKLRAMILLGINCGLQAHDLQAMPIDSLHLDTDTPYHDFRRVKNLRPRRAVLWPETVEAIKAWLEVRPHPKTKQDKPILFLTNCGGRHVPSSAHQVIGYQFRQAASGTKVKLPDGVSFGSLRHTFATVAELAGDDAMSSLIMGHTKKGIRRKHYVQRNLRELKRLKAVADLVREWLYAGKIDGEAAEL
jgi:integrase